MTAIVSLLAVVTISIIMTRIATIALIHTGLSRESARFQARSAFTGAGFTTAESERVVDHPVRRRIILILMLLGNVGIVSAVSSLILTFVDPGGDPGSLVIKVVLLIAGLAVLWLASMSHWVDARLSRLIDWALRRYTSLEVRDYASLMHLAGEYRIAEIQVQADDWLADRTLGEARLREEGVAVLGITRRNGRYIGAPTADLRVLPGDVLIAYGEVDALARIDNRAKGWQAEEEHSQAVRRHNALEAEESRRQQEELRERRP